MYNEHCTWLQLFYAITNKASIMANSWEPKVSVSQCFTQLNVDPWDMLNNF